MNTELRYKKVSWSFTGCHCVASAERTSTFPSTAMALAIAGSQVAASDVAGENKTVRMPVQTIRLEQVAHRFITLPIAHLNRYPECDALFEDW